MYLVSPCGQLDNYNLSYWLQLISAVTLTCSLLRENQPTPVLLLRDTSGRNNKIAEICYEQPVGLLFTARQSAELL